MAVIWEQNIMGQGYYHMVTPVLSI